MSEILEFHYCYCVFKNMFLLCIGYSQSEDSGFIAEGARQHGLTVFPRPTQPSPAQRVHRGPSVSLPWASGCKYPSWGLEHSRLQAAMGARVEDCVAFVGKVKLHIYQRNNEWSRNLMSLWSQIGESSLMRYRELPESPGIWCDVPATWGQCVSKHPFHKQNRFYSVLNAS